MFPCVAEVGTPWVPDAPEEVLPVDTVAIPAAGVEKVTLLAERAVRVLVVIVLFLAAGGLAGGGGAEG